MKVELGHFVWIVRQIKSKFRGFSLFGKFRRNKFKNSFIPNFLYGLPHYQ